jgi:hypothetical protein
VDLRGTISPCTGQEPGFGLIVVRIRPDETLRHQAANGLPPKMSHIAQTNQREASSTALHQRFAALRWIVALLLGLLCRADGQQVRLELNPLWQDRPLALAQPIKDAEPAGFSITRFDGLLSELALQRTNGTWLESDTWHVFFSVEQQRLTAMADGLPPEPFQAIRFRVGVNAKTDRSDPQSWPPGHPLHPDVCGLHWGWSSGYVFLAVEGLWESAPGQRSGFSYHLAGADFPMMVELPVRFSGAQPTTIALTFDVAQWCDDGAVVRGATSTHSRPGDMLAQRLKANVAPSNPFEQISTSPPWLCNPLRKLRYQEPPRTRLQFPSVCRR